MIVVKTQAEIEAMRQAGRIAATALMRGGAAIKPGITTRELDQIMHDYIVGENATPSFLGYGGFPASTCISVNNVVIHGIPDETVLKQGDIVSIDVGAYFNGFHGDNAATFPCGEISSEAEELIRVTKECFEKGMAAAVVGNRIGDIAYAVQTHAESHGFGVVYDFVGHGIGREMHEAPQVPNLGAPGRGPRLSAGMTLAIEPMITQFEPHVTVLEDEWTVITNDHGLTSHHENTIVITENEPEILTKVE